MFLNLVYTYIMMIECIIFFQFLRLLQPLSIKFSMKYVLSPKHGQISYIWEYRVDELTYWDTIAVPSHTCLLYVKDFGDYKCTIGDSENVHLFTVALPGTYLFVIVH